MTPLGDLPDTKKSAEDLVDLISATTGEAKIEAARTLCRRKNWSRVLCDIPQLLSLAEDPDIRSFALQTLNIYGTCADLSALMTLVHKGSAADKILALRAMTRIAPKSSLQQLEHLDFRDQVGPHREHLRTLTVLGDQRGFGELAGLLRRQDVAREIFGWGALAIADPQRGAAAWSSLVLSRTMSWPQDLEAIDLAGKIGDFGNLLAVYAMTSGRNLSRHHLSEIADLTVLAPLELGLPLIRDLLGRSDPALRRAVESWLRQEGHEELIERLRSIQVRLMELRNQRSTDLVPGLKKLLKELLDRGIKDWGLAYEILKRDRSPETLRELAGQHSQGSMANFLRRMVSLLVDDRTLKAKLEASPYNTIIKLKGRRIVVSFRLSLEAESSGIVSGVLANRRRFETRIVTSQGSRQLKPLLMPALGILPGETVEFHLPVLLTQQELGAGRLEIRLTGQTNLRPLMVRFKPAKNR